ncbi:hypothetical protein [uncultured Victivallis sp.]|uniref:hypothetical protein n=1 Tax=uncultured Victivallis sp. TaxID=354118 RepID=UPI0025954EE6|nr:hypothetical protein [uncultured Victivallis sp.]
MSIVFGLASFKNAVAGLHLQTVTYGETASSAEAIDEDGNIEQIDMYGKKRTIQCEGNVVAEGDISALTVGGELTIGGKKYTIDNVSVREGVNGHKTASINGSAPMEAAEGGGS